MRRTRRTRHRSLFSGNPLMRVSSLILMLFVLGLMFTRAREPATWEWLTSASAAATNPSGAAAAPPAPVVPPSAGETLVPGPTDIEEFDQDDVRMEFAAVTDRTELEPMDMPAYWRCLRWARAQPFAELARRATSDVAYTQLWETPAEYRGKLVRMRLHIRRLLKHDKLENAAGVTEVYEPIGWTDESKSFPIFTVTSEIPPGTPTGTDVRVDMEFVGYFVKNMAYHAEAGKKRYAPLLIGRVRLVHAPPAGPAGPVAPAWPWAAGTLLVVLVVGGWAWRRYGRLSSRRPQPVASFADQTAEDWFRDTPGEPPAPSDSDSRSQGKPSPGA